MDSSQYFKIAWIVCTMCTVLKQQDCVQTKCPQHPVTVIVLSISDMDCPQF